MAPHQVAQNVESGAEVVICCEADEQWSYIRCKGNQRWLFYAYDRIRKRVIAHVFGPRNALTLKRLLGFLSQFSIAFYMTDAWAGIPNFIVLNQSCYKQEMHPADRAT
ncbi:hypothetical protein I6G98_00700 (plasmid) [Escherichia coli]|nr:hypothetical protein [Escherichia coli]EHD3375462.1 hypothetical protein [Escherichia coli O124]EFI7899759.1 hypothetical protein [Escherichia coli]EFJ9901339.1 hypothetical protein [Escherichia coli]EFK6762809.1 hypothetical protein [Escherichia coli]